MCKCCEWIPNTTPSQPFALSWNDYKKMHIYNHRPCAQFVPCDGARVKAWPRGKTHSTMEKKPTIARTCAAEDVDGVDNKCSYKKQRDIKVAKIRKIMKPLEIASKDV